MSILKLFPIFQQAQYDIARGQSEPVEDPVVPHTKNSCKFKQLLNI